jgi:hypothetical protein
MHTDKQVKNAEKCFGKNSSLVTFLSIALIVNALWRDELSAGLVTFGLSAFDVTSCSFNSSHRNGLSIRMLCACVTSDEFLPKIFLRCFVVTLS